MAGVLQFTLGLQANQFLQQMGISSSSLLSFSAIAGGLQRVFDGVWGAIERGAALDDLSNRTRESAGNLYRLEEAFKLAGVRAESLPRLLQYTSKALGGVDEAGQRTGQLFAALGLDMDQLRQSDAPTRILAMAEALSKVNTDQATSIAERLFGQDNAGNMMQIAADVEGFRDVLRETAVEAAIIERSRKAFAAVGDAVDNVKRKANGLFLGIAEGAAPAMKAVIEMANIDWVGIGQQIGRVLTAITQAFKEGKLSELIALTLRTGFEAFIAVAPALLAKLGSMLINTFQMPLIYLQAGLEYVIDQAVNNPKMRKLLQLSGGAPLVATLDALGVTSGTPTSWNEILQQRKEDGLRMNFGTGEFGLAEIEAEADAALKRGMERMKEASKALNDEIARLFGNAGNVDSRDKAPPPNWINLPGSMQQASSWEKIGLVIGGSGRDSHDREMREISRQQLTAANQSLRVQKLMLNTLGSFGFTNT